MLNKILFIFLFSIGFFTKCQINKTVENNLFEDVIGTKQKGAHVFRIKPETNLDFVKNTNVEWITLVSWAYQKDFDSAELIYSRGDEEEIKKRDSTWIEHIKSVKNKGFKVFMKPHVWISDPSDGKWRSDIKTKSEEDWKIWSVMYSDFILRFAKISQEANADMFCIGVELTNVALNKPEFFNQLIKKVKKIYKGKITYAANWYQEFEKIKFWGNLDFIGIQAYFPLAKNEFPTIEEIDNGWKKYIPIFKKTAITFKKPILFTELGYKSTSDSAKEPWTWMEHAENDKFKVSLATQENCFKSFFKMIWPQKWFAGVHLWQYRVGYEKWMDHNNKDFIPLGKPAEFVIKNGFN